MGFLGWYRTNCTSGALPVCDMGKGTLENQLNFLILLVEPRGIEPLTFALRTRRSPS